jgi:JAB1/Mov34/MPN/PAD-1 ubiquitin protease
MSDSTNPTSIPVSMTAQAVQEAEMSVIVHPLVLLSCVDHFNRVAKDTKKRVVGVLLGETFKNKGLFEIQFLTLVGFNCSLFHNETNKSISF